MRAKTANFPALGRSPGRVAVLAYHGLSMFEFSVACEIFGRVETESFDVAWYQFAVHAQSSAVRFDNGMTLHVPATLASARRADTIVLPPCEDPWAVPDEVLAVVRRAHARGARIVSLCTGAFVLARTGLLDGRRAVTHWADCPRFESLFPNVTLDPSVLYVDDGDILTSAGSAASIDLCLHILRCDLGAEVATRMARQLVVQPHRDGGQAQFIDAPMPSLCPAEPLGDTLAWVTEHLHEDLTIAELAARASVSPRSFARRFVSVTGSTPYQWLLRQRIQQAQRMLEGTDLPVEIIATRVGLKDATNLRKHFRRQLGTSPQAYRRAFTADRSA